MSETEQKRSGSGITAGRQLAVIAIGLAAISTLYFVSGTSERTQEQAVEQVTELNAIARLPNAQQTDYVAEHSPPRAFDGDTVRVSPDGTRLAFLRGARFQRDIWVAPLDAVEDAVPLGLAENQGVLQFEWALDNAHIVFRRPFDVLNQVYSADVETGVTIALNSFEGSVAGGISLSPRHPQEALLRLGETPEAEPDLYLVNLVSGELRLVESAGLVGEYYADEDFVVRAGRTLDTRGFTIFARSDSGWNEVRFVAREPGEQAGVLYLGGTRNRLYVLDDEGRNTIGLSSIDLATGEREVIAAPEDGDVAQVLRDPTTSEIFAYAVARGDGIQWHALDPASIADAEGLNALPGGNARVLSQSLDNMIWTIRAGNNFYILDRASGAFTQITS